MHYKAVSWTSWGSCLLTAYHCVSAFAHSCCNCCWHSAPTCLLHPAATDALSPSINRAVVLLNLNVAYNMLPFTWWYRLPLATSVTLCFGRPSQAASSVTTAAAAAAAVALVPTGDVITHHAQDLSFMDALWWNPAWDWFQARFWGRISGRILSLLVQFEEPLVTK